MIGSHNGKAHGSADLPLHGGRVPPWLSTRMARLGRVIVEALVLEYGRDELLRRLTLGVVVPVDAFVQTYITLGKQCAWTASRSSGARNHS
jgi:hypothetical protein